MPKTPLTPRTARGRAALAAGLAALLTVGVGLVVPAPCAAQQPTTVGSARTIDLAAGVAQVDFTGSEMSSYFAFRGSLAVTTVVLLEASLGYAGFRDDAGLWTSLWIPELGVQAQLASSPIAPYLGLGVGVASQQRNDGRTSRNDFTVSGAIGARVAITGPVSLRGELRGRGMGPDFDAKAAEWTLGLSWRL